VLASGFVGLDNPEHAGNGLLFALDNTFVCSQHPVRFVPEGDSLRSEAVSPHGQWGISEDAVGRHYHSPNSDPLLVDLVPKQYAARNDSLKGFEGVPARAATDTRVWPSHLTPGVNRGYQKGVLKDGRLANFTGACSPHVHDGAAMGADMDGCALVCEVAGNLVHRYRLDEKDGRVVATHADGERSFWTSTDERFRPVFCTAGTDGAIYVADMYRGVIQHRNFMTSFLRQQVEARGLELPVDAGRIWRLVPKNASGAARKPVDLAKASALDLVGHLRSPEKSVRTLARRLLVERRDAQAVEAMRAAIAAGLGDAARPELLLEYLWALAGCDAADRALVERVLARDEPVFRVHALRVAERVFPQAELAAVLARAIEDNAPEVRVQAVLSAGSLDPMLRVAVLERGLARDIAVRTMRSAVLASANDAEPMLLEAIVAAQVLADDSVGARAFAAELTDMLLDDGSGRPDASLLATMLSTAAQVAPQRPWLAKAMLERIGARQRLNSREPAQLVVAYEPSGWFALLDALPAELAIATPIDRNLFWPGREDVSFLPPKIAKTAEMSLEDFGKRLYSNCMSCHQANGRGLPPVYPPLRGSEIVHGDAVTLVKIVMYGLEGKIEVDGQTYNQVMPAAPVRGDDEIAAVLTYVRSAWGNSGSAIDAALVAKVREETKGRNKPFTARELGIEAK
jgi:mono/diheme cytochrome c family protein